MKFEADQPVVFDLTNDSCSFHDGSYTQPVQFGDITQIQAMLEPCDGEGNVVSDSGFCLGVAGPWDYLRGKGVLSYDDCGANHSPGSASTIQQRVLTVGEYYRLEVIVESITAGKVRVFLGFNKVAEITAAGNYIFYGFCDHDRYLRVNFTFDSDARVSLCSAFRIPLDHKILINNSAGTTLASINMTDYLDTTTVIGQPFGLGGAFSPNYEQNQLGGTIFRLVDQYLTIKIDWNDYSLSEGCYSIGIADSCENTNAQNGIFNADFSIVNADFSQSQANWFPEGWTLDTAGGGSGSWSITNNQYTLTADGGAYFDETNNEYLSSNNAAFNLNGQSLSMYAVVKFQSLVNSQILCGRWTSGSEQFLLWYNSGNGRVRAYIHDGTSTTQAESLVTISTDTWYFIAYQFDFGSGNLRVSVNNETWITTNQASGLGAQNVAVDFRVGWAGGLSYLLGTVGKIAVWTDSITQANVATLYANAYGIEYDDLPAGLTANLLAWYSMTEDSGTRADDTGNYPLTDNNTVTTNRSYVDIVSKSVPGATIAYDTTFVINDEVNGGTRLQLGDTNGTFRFTENTFTEQITCGTNPDFTVRHQGYSGPSYVVLDSADLVLDSVSDYVSDRVSQIHNVQTLHECSVLIHMVNNHNAYGFEFERSTFIPTIRLLGRIRTAQYSGEREMYWDGLGNKKVSYARRRKLQSLLIEKSPERVYDFIMLGWGIDHFYVNNDEYVWTDDEPPAITWNQMKSLGTAEIEIESKVQDKFNINKGTRRDVGAFPPSTETILGGASEITGDDLNFADVTGHTINPGS